MTKGLRRSAGFVVVVLALVVALPSAAIAIDATDPRRTQLWWFDTLGIESAWDVSQGEDVVIAVLDTGVDTSHPDLQGQLAEVDGTFGRDFIDEGAMFDPNGHGTIVAGLVAAAANNDIGVSGVAPNAKVLPVRVLDSDGRGDASTVDAGIRWAVDNGADVINLSLEVEETEDGPDATLTAPNAAIEYAWENGAVVIAATGNSGGGAAGYPEGSPVVLVGASEREDERAAFSDAERLDAVMAPGVEMVSTWCQPDGQGGCNTDERSRYGIGNGTSFSAPVAAGVVALLLGSGLDHETAVEVLRDTAVDLGPEGPDLTFGVGRIDAAAALGASTEVAPGPDPDPTTPEPTATDSPSPGVAGAGDDGVADLPEGTDASEAPTADTTSPETVPDEDDGDGVVAAPTGEPLEESGALGLVAAMLLIAAFAATWVEARARTGS